MDCDCEKKVEEPSHFFLDGKDAKYYRNQFLNSCKMASKYCDKIKNQINNLVNLHDQLDSLQHNWDPASVSLADFLNKLNVDIDGLNIDVELFCNKIKDEFVELQSKDFQKMIDDNVRAINEIEESKHKENN